MQLFAQAFSPFHFLRHHTHHCSEIERIKPTTLRIKSGSCTPCRRIPRSCKPPVATTRNVRNVALLLEINPRHRSQLKVDEQQEEIVDADADFLDHADKVVIAA